MEARGPRLNSLTSLRAFAALAVFSCHARGYLPIPVAWVQQLTDAGPTGVSFFFILSGFVLYWAHTGNDAARLIYRRRVARIVPVYFLALLTGLIFFGPHSWSGLAHAIPSLFFVQAWFPDESVFTAANPVLWSLSCEAFFYLLFPFLARKMARQSLAKVVTLAVACVAFTLLIGLTVRGSSHDTVAYWMLYIFPPTRLAEFVLGMCLAWLLKARALPPIPLSFAALLTGIAYFGSTHTPDHFMLVAATLIPFALLIVAAAQSDLMGRSQILKSRILVKAGEMSFAFYLFHILVLMELVKHFPPEGTLHHWERLISMVACAAAVAAAVFRFYEMPLERRLRSRKQHVETMTELQPTQIASHHLT
jgi:peptidoglycan/LPS O-acetylase OafA/YrhL